MDADKQARRAADRGADALAAKLREAVARARSSALRIPEVEADPVVDFPGNVWLMADGRLRSRTLDGLIHEYAPTTTPGGSTSTKPKPADATLTRHRKTYPATWGLSISTTGSVSSGGSLTYGPSAFGNTGIEYRAMIGLDDATIRTDLAGATIRRVELRARNVDAAFGEVAIHWGAHNRSSPPPAYSAVRRDLYVADWPKVGYGQAWRTIPVWLGNQLRDGTARGLTIDQPIVSPYWRGQVDWSTVQVRITYTS